MRVGTPDSDFENEIGILELSRPLLPALRRLDEQGLQGAERHELDEAPMTGADSNEEKEAEEIRRSSSESSFLALSDPSEQESDSESTQMTCASLLDRFAQALTNFEMVVKIKLEFIITSCLILTCSDSELQLRLHEVIQKKLREAAEELKPLTKKLLVTQLFNDLCRKAVTTEPALQGPTALSS